MGLQVVKNTDIFRHKFIAKNQNDINFETFKVGFLGGNGERGKNEKITIQ